MLGHSVDEGQKVHISNYSTILESKHSSGEQWISSSLRKHVLKFEIDTFLEIKFKKKKKKNTCDARARTLGDTHTHTI